MKKWIVSAGFALVFGTMACTHFSQREPAAIEGSSISAEDRAEALEIIQNRDAKKLYPHFFKIQSGQSLVSGFDARIGKIKKEDELDVLYESQLYCDLMKLRPLYEHADDELIEIARVAMASTDSEEAIRWFIEQMIKFAKDLDQRGPASVMAMANLFRGLVQDEEIICGSDGCLGKKAFLFTSDFGFNPLNRNAYRDYRKQNQKDIESWSYTRNATNLKPGDCFEHDPLKRKPQSEGFDWVNRNWVGAVLPKGQFAFTYDDGPHSSYTRAIRDTWANAGMAKPAFFWLRKNVSNLPEIVKELNEQNYIIGSHSERHADLGNLAKANSPADLNGVNKQAFGPELKNVANTPEGFAAFKNQTLDREINQSVKDLSDILGKPVRYFRLPYGSGVRNSLIGQRFQDLNLEHFFWRVDSLDWQDKYPESIRDRVVAQMKTVQKGIILFHDIHPQSAEAAKLMVEFLKDNKDFKAVNIMDLPGLTNK
jgi:peptidoglycan/xylan/chitin deacetylase (PgdA/CDA1 family)